MFFQIVANIITTLSLIAGLSSILFAISYKFVWASGFIAISVIADMLDGRIARLNPVPSEFGKEYDSLADMVSFGIAPAVLMYTFAFRDELRIIYLLILFAYLFAGAYRLARYNIYSSGKVYTYFKGLPITASGGFLAGIVLWLKEFNISLAPMIFVGILGIVSLLMLSTIKYSNFSNARVAKGAFGVISLIVFIIFAIFSKGLIILPLLLIYLVFIPFFSGNSRNNN